MNHENEVKLRWTMPGRHIQHTIFPFNKYSWPIAYSLKKQTNTQKLNTEQLVLVFLSNTICNRSTIFGVWKYFMMNMSVIETDQLASVVISFSLDAPFTNPILICMLIIPQEKITFAVSCKTFQNFTS